MRVREVFVERVKRGRDSSDGLKFGSKGRTEH